MILNAQQLPTKFLNISILALTISIHGSTRAIVIEFAVENFEYKLLDTPFLQSMSKH